MEDGMDNYSKLQKAADLLLEVFNSRNDSDDIMDMSFGTKTISVAYGKTISSIHELRSEERAKSLEGIGEVLSDEDSSL